MSNELKPRVGHWYADRDSGKLFRVVALDAPAGLVETQDYDGSVAELDRDMWRELDLELAAAPEDTSGAYDTVDADETDEGICAPAADWHRAWQSTWPAPERWQDTCTLVGMNESQSNRLADLYAREMEKEDDAA